MYGKPAPEVAIDTDNYLPPAPKDANDEETASWCGPVSGPWDPLLCGTGGMAVIAYKRSYCCACLNVCA